MMQMWTLYRVQVISSIFRSLLAIFLFYDTRPLPLTYRTIFLKIVKASYTYRTERFIGVEQRLNFAFLIFEFAVLDCILPVACLLLDIEIQTCRTSDSLKALGRITFTGRNLARAETDLKAITEENVMDIPMMCTELRLCSYRLLLPRVGTILQRLCLYIVPFQSSPPFWLFLLVASPFLRIGLGHLDWWSRSLFAKESSVTFRIIYEESEYFWDSWCNVFSGQTRVVK